MRDAPGSVEHLLRDLAPQVLGAVGGLTTAEIARAFLVPEATMAQRISRAKQSIRTSGLPLALPEEAERSERLGSVLHVLYLIFNEGYASSAGPRLHRAHLSDEALRLARLLHGLLPEDGEVAGLLALMLLTDARRAARTGPAGELVPLDEQDRFLWDRSMIDEGVALLTDALPRGPAGPYLLQAAVAAAMVHGPEAGLALLEPLADDPRVRDGHRLPAVRAHLLERMGEHARAAEQYLLAAGRTASLPEREYLRLKAARVNY